MKIIFKKSNGMKTVTRHEPSNKIYSKYTQNVDCLLENEVSKLIYLQYILYFNDTSKTYVRI